MTDVKSPWTSAETKATISIELENPDAKVYQLLLLNILGTPGCDKIITTGIGNKELEKIFGNASYNGKIYLYPVTSYRVPRKPEINNKNVEVPYILPPQISDLTRNIPCYIRKIDEMKQKTIAVLDLTEFIKNNPPTPVRELSSLFISYCDSNENVRGILTYPHVQDEALKWGTEMYKAKYVSRVKDDELAYERCL